MVDLEIELKEYKNKASYAENELMKSKQLLINSESKNQDLEKEIDELND